MYMFLHISVVHLNESILVYLDLLCIHFSLFCQFRPYKKKNPGSQTPPRAQNSSRWDVFIVGREKNSRRPPFRADIRPHSQRQIVSFFPKLIPQNSQLNTVKFVDGNSFSWTIFTAVTACCCHLSMYKMTLVNAVLKGTIIEAFCGCELSRMVNKTLPLKRHSNVDYYWLLWKSKVGQLVVKRSVARVSQTVRL